MAMKELKREYKGFTVGDYPNGMFLILDNKRIDESIEFMKAEGIYGLVVNYINGCREPDIAFLNKFSFIKYINLLHWGVEDISIIHELNNLETLIIQTTCKTPVDFSCFHKLKVCRMNWLPKRKSVLNCTTLEELTLNRYKPKNKDLGLLSDLTELKILEIKSSPLHTLTGIENLQKLEILELHYLRSFRSIAGIQKLPVLNELVIGACKKIETYEPLSHCSQLKTLVLENVGNIATLKPMQNLTNLELLALYESKVEDGDLSYLKKLPKLKKLFLREYQHYSHTKNQILK